MRVLVSGSSGLIGSALVKEWLRQSVDVVRLLREETRSKENAIYWQPYANAIVHEDLEGFEAVIHLAGENVANGRWSENKKKGIRESRVKGTRLLCQSLSNLSNPPKVLVAASAIGFYGDRGDSHLSEESPAGSGFLADVCQEWERATEVAAKCGVRVVNLRIGIVLSTKSGALAKMITPFKLGLGGVLGSGTQYMSWIALEDVVRAIEHIVRTPEIRGPVNCVSPNAVTNREFTRTLALVLNRPALFPVPKEALRILMGEMADDLLLASARVEPTKLVAANFSFAHQNLELALREIIATGK